MTFPVVYDPAIAPTDGPQPGAIALRAWILTNYPLLGDLGIYVNRPVRGGRALSTHAEGRAIDIGTPDEASPTPEARDDGRVLARRLIAHHPELGVQLIIFDRRVWSGVRAAEGWRPYTGSNAHRGHLHIELNRAAAAGLTPDLILDTLGGDAPMSDTPDRTARIRDLQRKLALAGLARGWWDEQPIDPDDLDAIERYADGDPGPRTILDLAHAIELATAPRPVAPTDPAVDDRLALLDDLVDAIVRLNALTETT